jgi:hypothetical protein
LSKISGVRSINPFTTNGKINKKKIPVIIDTGADVSIMNKNLFEICDLKGLKPSKAILKSASGDRLNVIGEVENVKIYIQNKKVISDLIITESEPKEYAIIGANTIIKKKTEYFL